MPRLTLTDWSKTKHGYQTPCPQARAYMRRWRNAGLTPRQIWETCNSPTWMIWIVDVFFREREDQIAERLGTYTFASLWFGGKWNAKRRREICDAIRAEIPWSELKSVLLTAGWR